MSSGKSINRVALTMLLALLLSACGGSGGDIGDEAEKPGPGPIEEPFTILPPSVGFGSVPAFSTSNSTFLGDHFSGSGACGVCHNEQTDDNGRDVSLSLIHISEPTRPY